MLRSTRRSNQAQLSRDVQMKWFRHSATGPSLDWESVRLDYISNLRSNHRDIVNRRKLNLPPNPSRAVLRIDLLLNEFTPSAKTSEILDRL